MRMIALLVVVGGAGCASHTAAPDAATVMDCSAIAGKSFASLTQGECGLGPNGPVPCTWHINFTPGLPTSFSWQHSDVEESGQVTCAGSVVQELGPPTYKGTYDQATQHLVWEGTEYAP